MRTGYHDPADIREDTKKTGPGQTRALDGNPSTCDPIYSDEQRIFMLAMQGYKEKHGIIDPSPRDILSVVKSLGYRKVCAAGPLPKFRGRTNG